VEIHAVVALIAVASFAAGAVQPTLSAWLVSVICRRRGHARPNMLAALGAMAISLGVCSTALVFLSSLDRAPGFAIAIPFLLGIGATRLVRREI
jgi:hypothetical protein